MSETDLNGANSSEESNESTIVVDPNDQSADVDASEPGFFLAEGDISDANGAVIGSYRFDTAETPSFTWESMIEIKRTDGFKSDHPAYNEGQIYQLFGYNASDNRIEKAKEEHEHIKEMLAKNSPIEDIEKYIDETREIVLKELPVSEYRPA